MFAFSSAKMEKQESPNSSMSKSEQEDIVRRSPQSAPTPRRASTVEIKPDLIETLKALSPLSQSLSSQRR